MCGTRPAGIKPEETVHCGDRFTRTGNDLRARDVANTLWVASPMETEWLLNLLIQDLRRHRAAALAQEVPTGKFASAVGEHAVLERSPSENGVSPVQPVLASTPAISPESSATGTAATATAMLPPTAPAASAATSGFVSDGPVAHSTLAPLRVPTPVLGPSATAGLDVGFMSLSGTELDLGRGAVQQLDVNAIDHHPAAAHGSSAAAVSPLGHPAIMKSGHPTAVPPVGQHAMRSASVGSDGTSGALSPAVGPASISSAGHSVDHHHHARGSVSPSTAQQHGPSSSLSSSGRHASQAHAPGRGVGTGLSIVPHLYGSAPARTQDEIRSAALMQARSAWESAGGMVVGEVKSSPVPTAAGHGHGTAMHAHAQHAGHGFGVHSGSATAGARPASVSASHSHHSPASSAHAAITAGAAGHGVISHVASEPASSASSSAPHGQQATSTSSGGGGHAFPVDARHPQ